MSTTARMEQVADMVAYYRTGRGLDEVGLRVGYSAMAVMHTLRTYGGVRMRSVGHYAQQPRINENATSESWRCVECKRGAAEGAIRASGRSYCVPCKRARERAVYHRQRERVAS